MNKTAIKSEVIRSGRDPVHFIRNYVKIQHPVRGLIPFDLFDYQEELLASFRESRSNGVLKARQLGVSEITAAYIAWLVLFHRDKNVLIIATKRETAANIIRKIRTSVANIPPWLFLCEITVDNVYSIEFSNGSRVKAVSRSKDAGRSEALSLLVLDEAAHIENLEEIWAGLKPTISAGGSVIMISTPNGVGNLFFNMWAGSQSGENDFVFTKLMWWVHPERQEGLRDDPYRPGFKTSEWFEEETKGMTEREIAQELECNFNSSGDNVLPAAILDLIRDQHIMVPASFEYVDRNIHVFRPWEPGLRHFVAADVARGDGADYSAAHVFTVETMEQVAEYKGQIPVDEFAVILARMGGDFGGAPLFVENNATGLLCIDHLRQLRYDSIYYGRKNDNRPGEIMNPLIFVPDYREFVPGFTTSPRTRPLITGKLEEYIRKGKVTIRSERLLDELRHWIWYAGRAQAQHGFNDDLVMAAAIACWMHETFYASTVWNEQANRNLLNGMSYKPTTTLQVPGATKDPRFVKTNERIANAQRHVQRAAGMAVPDGRGGMADIGWLLDRK